MRHLFAKLDRKLFLFLLSGGIQYCLDLAIFSLATFLELNPQIANITSRCLAASFGFGFNGWVVFEHFPAASKLQVVHSGFKFFTLLACLTLISTLLMTLGIYCFGKERQTLILLKISIELLLAITSFIVQRYLVFGKK